MSGLFGNSSNVSTSTQTPAGLEYLTQAANMAFQTAGQPFQPYYGETVAGLTPGQYQSIGQLQNTWGTATPYFNTASNYLNQAGNMAAGAGQSVLPFMQRATSALDEAGTVGRSMAERAGRTFDDAAATKYMNPYINNVVTSTMNVLDENNAKQRNQLAGNVVARGAFGGDRAGVAAAELSRQQNLGRDSTVSGLYAQGYNNAQSQFNTDEARALQGSAAQLSSLGQAANTNGSLGQLSLSAAMQPAQFMGQLGQASMGLGQAAQLAQIRGATAGLQGGTVEQQTRQAQNNADYSQFMRGVQYPFDTVGWLANIINGISARQGTTTQTTTPGPSGTSQAIGAGLTGLGLLNQAGNGGFDGIGKLFSGMGFADGGRVGLLTGGPAEDDGIMPEEASSLANITAAPPKVAAASAMPMGMPRAPNRPPAGSAAIAAAQAVPLSTTMPTAPMAEANTTANVPMLPPPTTEAPKGATPQALPNGASSAPNGDFSNAIMTAGLAMMAGTSPHAMANIGQGGLAGMQAYQQSQKDRAAAANAQAELEMRKQSGARDDKRIDLEAKSLAQRLEDSRLARARQESIDAVEMPYKKALTEKALKDVNRNEFAERSAAAASVGLVPGSPAYQSYLLTGTIPKNDQVHTASDRKAIQQSDDAVYAATNAIDALNGLKGLSKEAWGFTGAGVIAKGLSPVSDGAAKTVEFDNAAATNAVSQLKAIFGGNPTEGERKVLLDIAGSSAMPDAVRQKVFDRAIAMAERKLAMEKQRGEELRGGEYFKPKPKGDKPATPDKQSSSNDPLSAARAAIQNGADRAKVEQRLRDNGIDPKGL